MVRKSDKYHHMTDPTERTLTERSTTDRSSSSEEFIRQHHALREDQFVDEYKSHKRRVSHLGRDALSMSKSEYLDELDGSDIDSSFHGSAAHNRNSATPDIAEKEARQVFWSKVLVGLVLVASTSLLGYFTFQFVRHEEQNEFKNQFLDYADEIVDQSKNNAISSLAVLESLSKTVTSLAMFANESWPLISLPHFEIRASDYLDISGAQQIAFAPIVQEEEREPWEAYTTAHQDWIQDGLDLEYELVMSRQEPEIEAEASSSIDENTEVATPGTNMNGFASIGKAQPIQETVWAYEEKTHRPATATNKGPYIPLWQSYPAPRNSFVVNYNLLSSPVFTELIYTATVKRRAVLSDIIDNFVLFGTSQSVAIDPKSVVIQPIFSSFDANSNTVGFMVVVIPWYIYFNDVLSKGANSVICVLRNSCGEDFSYEVSGPEATFLGVGDFHDPNWDHMEVSSQFATLQDTNGPGQYHSLNHQVESMCNFSLHVYPSQAMHDSFESATPIYITLAVVGIFAFTTLVFLLYDVLVQRMQSKVVATALKTTAIVTSLFPAQVHERLFESAVADHSSSSAMNQAPKYRLRSYLSDEEKQQQQQEKKREKRGTSVRQSASEKSAPIADLFPECTVMFCDIAGFTAWSSVREPSQVFVLLESVYAAFDDIANRRKVFKVETIGDCYLAVCGLPTPRKDHAIAMVKFASDCLIKMKSLAQSLELELGPGTGDLTMRFGLHSGPVTAGVLRGEKTRFQLFGDTVNTASRMESTGKKDKIQVSEETANILKASGKEKWIKPREDKILAKGKGELQTFWANPRFAGDLASSTGSNHNIDGLNLLLPVVSTRQLHASLAFKSELDARRKRCVHWIGEIMIKLLKQIVARRAVAGTQGVTMKKEESFSAHFTLIDEQQPIDEVKDIITLPKFDPKVAKKQADASLVKLPEDVMDQLHNYIAEIALLYRDNPFHNFDHASHVTMSVSKLLARIVAPDSVDPAEQMKRKKFESLRHDHTYGITSDPLTQFAVVFSALIHDADHPGCPNTVLVRDKTELAYQYHNKSPAEQNSLDLCWNLLMLEKYQALRSCICTNQDEMKRFRQLVVNSIIATDISDKTLSEKRKARWNIAFHAQASDVGSSFSETISADHDGDSRIALEAVNRKATIVIEHLIQASDVAHTMQHWHIYTKWNEKLFQEMYKAYKEGKLEKDPIESWYQGELGFFDFYIIPLAKKLKECGVFGVSSAEYLNYAVANRREWEMRGKDVVKDMVARHITKSISARSEEGVPH